MWGRLKRFPQLLEADEGLTLEQCFAIRANEVADEGFTMCPGCEGVVESAPWCGECGAQLDAVKAGKRQRTCKRCNIGFPGRFCGGCGADYGIEVADQIRQGTLNPDKALADLTARVTPGLTDLWRKLREEREAE